MNDEESQLHFQFQFQTIADFEKIPIQADTLYVLDFDETVTYYDGIDHDWWKARIEHYYSLHECYDTADNYALDDWLARVEYLDPQHVDQDGYRKIIEHCESEPNSHVVILTARNIKLEDITKKHLQQLSPDSKVDIIFCNGEHKGEQMQQYIDLHELDYEHIIFVDDRLQNLVDFKSTHADAQCFHMIFK